MIRRYRSLNDVEQKFQMLFGVSFGVFYDAALSKRIGHITMDIVKFDNWVCKQIGDYEGKLLDVIRGKYGKDAEVFVIRLL